MSDRSRVAATFCALLLLSGANSAGAATYLFHFEGDGSNGYGDVEINGQFTTSAPLPSGGEGVAITGISGFVSGGSAAIVDGAISGLSPYAAADNILYNLGINTDDNYSFSGVSFYVGAPSPRADYNLFGWNGATNLLVSTIDDVGYPQNGTPAATPSVDNSITNSVLAVPEPATWAMMLLGLFGLGTVLRLRRNKHIEGRIVEEPSPGSAD